MKTVTDIVKLLGKEAHKGIDDLTKNVVKKCIEFDIKETKGNKPINEEAVNRIIRSILSNIKLGHGSWNKWSYRYGKGYLKLYDSPSVDIISVNKNTLEDLEYKDSPKIKVLVNPKKEGVEANEFYKEFDTLSEAKKFFDEEEYATDIYLFVGKLMIPLEESKSL